MPKGPLNKWLFLSTLSVRRATYPTPMNGHPGEFLSTLSVRRATVPLAMYGGNRYISIHALREESDQHLLRGLRQLGHFYPRSP